jgi:hypothetical protein
MYLQLSPLYPPDESGQALKGRIASNISHNKFGTITPLRGQGVKNTTLSHFTECN